MPTNVERDILLKRLVSAMNGDGTAGQRAVARGLMLENGNHNLSEGDGDKEGFVDAVGELLKLTG